MKERLDQIQVALSMCNCPFCVVATLSLMEIRKEIDQMYTKAQSIAADFIGYPCDEEDDRAIKEATPMQAMEALDKKLREIIAEQNAEAFERDLNV